MPEWAATQGQNDSDDVSVPPHRVLVDTTTSTGGLAAQLRGWKFPLSGSEITRASK
jgi:hypothetical protein